MMERCKKCGEEMYQDDHGQWFCANCILEEIAPAFLDEELDDPGELKHPYVLEPPTKQVSIRLSVADLELAKRLARRKGIPKYQSYIKTLLHEALVKEAESLWPASQHTYLEVMEDIRRRQQARGHRPPTKEEVDTYLQAERESWG